LLVCASRWTTNADGNDDIGRKTSDAVRSAVCAQAKGMRTLSAGGRARVVLLSSFPAPCVDNFSDCDFRFVMPVANKWVGAVHKFPSHMS
jgi:hypothetical protein